MLTTMRIPLTTAVAGVVLATAGCAALFNGFSQRVEVVSEPPGAEVFVNGEPAGTTPTEVVVSRRNDEHELRIVDAAGNAHYKWPRRRLSRRVAEHRLWGLEGWGAYFRSAEDNLEGNPGIAFFAGLLPAIVDIAFGGANEFPDRPRRAGRQSP